MTFTQPEETQISALTTDIGVPTLFMPVAETATRSRHYAVAFIAWLAISVAALKFPVDHFYPDKWNGTDALLATVALSVGWAVVGVIVVWLLVKTRRPAVPASLRLTLEGIDFDPGLQPPRFFSAEWRRGRNLSDCFPKWIRRRIDRQQFKSLCLREVETSARLSVDVGNENFEFARGVTDVERELLFGLIVDRYMRQREG